MPFNINPTVAAALAAMMGPNPPAPPPVGDVAHRRVMVEGIFNALIESRPKIEDVTFEDFHTPAEDGHELLLRWFTKTGQPTPPGSAILYCHGGGMIAMQLQQYEQLLKTYVSLTGVPFLAVEYRLAPEVRAPTPVTDCYAGLRWLVQQAGRLGVDASRIAIMGDSAGGGIAASLTHYCKLRGGPSVAHQILIYPMLDDRSTQVDPLIAPYLTWTTDDNITGWTALLGADRIGGDDVHVLEAAGRMTAQDARGLPPAYIDVGELDLFRDEDLEYARTLGKGGVSCEFHLIPGVPHAFEAFAPEADVSRFVMEQRCRVLKSL